MAIAPTQTIPAARANTDPARENPRTPKGLVPSLEGLPAILLFMLLLLPAQILDEPQASSILLLLSGKFYILSYRPLPSNRNWLALILIYIIRRYSACQLGCELLTIHLPALISGRAWDILSATRYEVLWGNAGGPRGSPF